MAISLAYGSERSEFHSDQVGPGDNKWQDSQLFAKHEEAARLAGIFTDRFKAEFGSLRCHGIQEVLFGRSWNTRDPKEVEDFHKQDTHEQCGNVCRIAARLAADVILAKALLGPDQAYGC
jgi:hypothetical protein